MNLTNLRSWLNRRKPGRGSRMPGSRFARRFVPTVCRLEDRDVPNGYLAIGAGPGNLPQVAIRVDIRDALGGTAPNNAGQPAAPRSDGKTETTSQILMAYDPSFRGGVNVATGNFDGNSNTPDQLVTAPKAGGGPHIIVWNTAQNSDGTIVVTGIRAQFFAFDRRFTGGVNIATGDLDGDGRAELIVAAGPGGGPHVRVFTTNAAGNFILATEFYAYAPSFRGGVSIASNQGYTSTTQVRQVLDDQLPDDFAPVPYAPGETVPGAANGIGLVGFDAPVVPGGTDFNTGLVVPTGNPGTLDDNFVPLPYITVGAGVLQYLSGNLINSYGQVIFRPNIFVPPQFNNPTNAGRLVFATWDDTTAESNYPTDGSAPPIDASVGPYVQLGETADGTAIITRLTDAPDQLNGRNQLVTGAGPGGGPHVRVWDFAGAGTGMVGTAAKEFFAFDSSFRGGVNVAIGDVISSPTPATFNGSPAVRPGRTDFTLAVPVFLIETTGNSGSSSTPSGWPFDTNLFRRQAAEVIVAMASGGSQVRVFADFNPLVPDPTSPQSDSAPLVRGSVAEVNLVPTLIDTAFGPDPTNPLGGFNGFTSTINFGHAIDPQFTGGVNPAVSAFTFEGSINDVLVGTNALFPAAGFLTNPVLGQSVFAAGHGAANPNRGSKVRIFNQLSELSQLSPSYNAVDDFAAFPTFSGVGVTPAYGFGALPNAGLDIQALNTISIETVDNPILI